MAHLYKKLKKGHEYYYIRETQRVYGKPTTVNQVYLGTADKVETLLGRGGFSPKEFGSVFILNELDKDLDLAGIINEILPPKKRTKGPSLGELVFYAALNRAIAPTSKRQLATWYETTDIQRIRPLRLESLNSQNFWNHWDRISDMDLERIASAFFRKVNFFLPAGERQLLIEATRLQSTPKSVGALDEELQDEDFAQRPQPQSIGLALVTERKMGVPLYYQTFSGALSEGNYFERGLDDLLARVNNLGVKAKDLTLLFNRGIDSEAMVNRLNSQEGLHFIASCPPDFAPELTKISLKEFSPLPSRINQRPNDLINEDDKVLFYETRADFWDRSRRVIITFDPKTFHKSYQELGKKVQKVRRELSALQQRYQQEAAGEDAPQAIGEHLAQLCQRLKLDPNLFQLSFPRENGRFNLALQLNHHQMASNVRHFGKNILITDREDWDALEIYETYSRRGVLEAQSRGGKTNGQWSNNGQDSQSPIYETLMPLYHWTGSKIRVHLFVCVVAMTYLALMYQHLSAKGVAITPREAMDELRSLKTAIFQESDDGKLKRMLDQVNDRQSAILQAMGYQVQEGKVLPL
jgi:transposase